MTSYVLNNLRLESSFHTSTAELVARAEALQVSFLLSNRHIENSISASARIARDEWRPDLTTDDVYAKFLVYSAERYAARHLLSEHSRLDGVPVDIPPPESDSRQLVLMSHFDQYHEVLLTLTQASESIFVGRWMPNDDNYQRFLNALRNQNCRIVFGSKSLLTEAKPGVRVIVFWDSKKIGDQSRNVATDIGELRFWFNGRTDRVVGHFDDVVVVNGSDIKLVRDDGASVADLTRRLISRSVRTKPWLWHRLKYLTTITETASPT